jgi:hypothetical protein
MTIKASPPGLQPEHYDQIEAALMATARGRAFLAEHARRSRNLENERMLAAIERLTARLEAQQARGPAEASAPAERRDELSGLLHEQGADEFACRRIDGATREFRGKMTSGPSEGTEAPPTDPAPPAPVIRAQAATSPAGDPRLAALSKLDSLSLIDRFALFS